MRTRFPAARRRRGGVVLGPIRVLASALFALVVAVVVVAVAIRRSTARSRRVRGRRPRRRRGLPPSSAKGRGDAPKTQRAPSGHKVALRRQPLAVEKGAVGRAEVDEVERARAVEEQPPRAAATPMVPSTSSTSGERPATRQRWWPMRNAPAAPRVVRAAVDGELRFGWWVRSDAHHAGGTKDEPPAGGRAKARAQRSAQLQGTDTTAPAPAPPAVRRPRRRFELRGAARTRSFRRSAACRPADAAAAHGCASSQA